MIKAPKVSIIIPVKQINSYVKEAIPIILKLNWPDFEIIILTDKKERSLWPKTRVIATGKVGPAKKRDLGALCAKGEILAFLDDDAYPKKDWLKKAIPHFKNEKIGAVGGPAITPKSDYFLQKVSGAIFESYLGGGGARDRYLSIGKTREIDDWPTVNLLVRKQAFEKIGGFDTAFWPGEDTKLCLDLINAGYKIIYEPQAIVYHHRRSDLLNHFKQIGNYGLHRGYFAKKYPQTSLKLWYFIPTFFIFYLVSLLLNALKGQSLFLLTLHFFPLSLYAFGLIADGILIAIRWQNFFIGLLTIPMIFLTHLWYGICFLHGLIIPKLTK